MKIGSRVELKTNPKMRGSVVSYKPDQEVSQEPEDIPSGWVSVQWDSGTHTIEAEMDLRPHIGVGLADKLRGLTLNGTNHNGSVRVR